MCQRCNGLSDHEIFDDQLRMIDQYGYFVTGVAEHTPGKPCWLYTVGLVDRFAHPEILVVSCDVQAAHRLIAGVVEEISRGATFDGLTHMCSRTSPRAIRTVHAVQLADGALAEWNNHYSMAGRADLELRALQLVADDMCCPRHRPSWDLHVASPLLNSTKGRGERSRTADADRRRKAHRQRQRAARRRNIRRGG